MRPLALNQGLPMFQELIDDYRRQAAQYIADAIELESGRRMQVIKTGTGR